MSILYLANAGSTGWNTVNLSDKYYTNSSFEIRSPTYNGTSTYPIYRLLDNLGNDTATLAEFDANHTQYWRIAHDTNNGSVSTKPLNIWFGLPNSIVLSQIKLTWNYSITGFEIYSVGSMTDTSANGVKLNVNMTYSFNNVRTRTYDITGNTSNNSKFYLFSVTQYGDIRKSMVEMTEVQFGYVPSPDPPVVTFPSSPSSTGIVNVTPNSGAASWEYSVNNGVTWTTGQFNGAGTPSSFTLPYGTYAINAIQVRNRNSSSIASAIVKNTSQIIVPEPIPFNPDVANNKKTELATLISSLPEVNNVKEIYELWYNTTQIYGGTDVWVYYVYDANSDNSIIYNTRKFRFDPSAQTWSTVLVSTSYVNASNPVSVSSNGLTAGDKTDYANMYTGLQPFQLDVSTASLTSLKSAYDNSGYSTNNISVVYNIWCDNRDIFDLSFSKTTRVVDTWIYVLTDGTDVNGNMIFDTRKVMYTITNDNATYAWTIPTNETVSSPTIANTQYTNIPESSNFVLSYFYFDAYMITNVSSIKDLRTAYETYFTNTKKITALNELWYDKSNITPGDTIYDTSYNDTKLTVNSISLILYGTKQDIDVNGAQSNSQWTKININYSKQTRNWSISGSDLYFTSINSGITDNVSNSGTSGFTQILSNILYGTFGKVANLKTTYNNLYNPDMVAVSKLWTTNSFLNVVSMFVLFSTSAGPLYTTAIYDRVIDGWAFNNQSEPYNALLADTVIYSEFIEAVLEGKLDNIKTAYTTAFTDRSIVHVHNLWYNLNTTSNSMIEGKIYHSYNSGPADTKLYFGLVDVSYNMQINTDNYSVAGTTFISQNYDYDGNAALSPVVYKEVVSYYVDVSFNVNTILPIMMDNSTIRAQFDASYNELNNTSLTINIHNVWIKTGTINGTNMNYMTPVQDMWVYYSFLNSSNITEYKSRSLSYNLQFNVWGVTNGNIIKPGTIRTSGLTTAELANYTKIFEFLPEVPTFSTGIASSSASLNNLEIAYATSQSIASNSLEISKLWYRIADARAPLVKCVVYLSISTLNGSVITKTYKTFIVNYNNDTNAWSIPDPFVQTNSTVDDDKFSIIISGENANNYFMFYSLPTGPSVMVSNNNILMNGAKHLHIPVGSILMYHKNSITLGTSFLVCDGTEYNVADYPELAGVLNYKYGGTSASGKFNVPDLKDRFPIGADNINDTSISTDDYANPAKRTGGNWTISSQQFVHTHPNVSHYYLNYLTQGGNMDNEGPSSSADWVKDINSTASMSQSGTPHKPLYFAVRHVIYTGKGRIGPII